MQYVFEDLHGGEIVFSGDTLPNGESAIVISMFELAVKTVC